MSNEQTREQLLSCLESLKLDLEELTLISSSIMVGQAIEMLETQGSKLHSYETGHSVELERTKGELAAAEQHVKILRDQVNEHGGRLHTQQQQTSDAYAKLAEVDAERLRAVSRLDHVHRNVLSLIDGIDREDSAEGGWWETSTGVEFGKNILAAIQELFRRDTLAH